MKTVNTNSLIHSTARLTQVIIVVEFLQSFHNTPNIRNLRINIMKISWPHYYFFVFRGSPNWQIWWILEKQNGRTLLMTLWVYLPHVSLVVACSSNLHCDKNLRMLPNSPMNTLRKWSWLFLGFSKLTDRFICQDMAIQLEKITRIVRSLGQLLQIIPDLMFSLSIHGTANYTTVGKIPWTFFGIIAIYFVVLSTNLKENGHET